MRAPAPPRSPVQAARPVDALKQRRLRARERLEPVARQAGQILKGVCAVEQRQSAAPRPDRRTLGTPRRTPRGCRFFSRRRKGLCPRCRSSAAIGHMRRNTARPAKGACRPQPMRYSAGRAGTRRNGSWVLRSARNRRCRTCRSDRILGCRHRVERRNPQTTATVATPRVRHISRSALSRRSFVIFNFTPPLPSIALGRDARSRCARSRRR